MNTQPTITQAEALVERELGASARVVRISRMWLVGLSVPTTSSGEGHGFVLLAESGSLTTAIAHAKAKLSEGLADVPGTPEYEAARGPEPEPEDDGPVVLQGLDWSWDTGEDFVTSLVEGMAQHPRISYRIDSFGPSSTGWPTVSFFAPSRQAMREFTHGVYSSGDDLQDDWLADEAVRVESLELEAQKRPIDSPEGSGFNGQYDTP